jgi:hypothetical protein
MDKSSQKDRGQSSILLPQYKGGWGSIHNGSSEAIFEQLRALPADASREQIDAVIRGWCTHWCDECGDYHPEVVSFGYDDSSADVCLSCLKKAIALFAAGSRAPEGQD